MRLDEICSHIVDCEHKTAPVTEGGGYFAVGTPAMQGNSIDYSQARQISRETYVAWTRRLTPRRGDLLFAREAPVGPVVRIPHVLNVAPGQRTVLLRPNPRIADPAFLYYLLTSPKTQRTVQDLAMGSTVPHLNVADVRALDLSIPSLGEQRAIAEVLGALDDKMAANGPLIETAERLMIALVEGLEATTTLGALAVLSKKQISPADLGSLPVSHYSLPAFDQSRLPTIEPGVSILSGKFALERPSVLLSKLNPRFPRVWNVQSPEERSVASTEFLVLHPQGVPTAALWAILARVSTQTFLAGRVSGTSGSHQRVRPQEALQIPVPDVRQFDPSLSARLVALSDAVDTARRESRTLAQLRDTLLPALMDGTLRVKDAVAQAEEVL